jgi:type II secretion system protein C
MRYIARLSRLVWALNLGLLVVILSLTVVSVLPPRPSKGTAAATHPKEEIKGLDAQDSKHPDTVDPKLILERDIFRVGQMAAAEEAKKVQNLQPERPKTEPKREVPLRLLGTVVDEGGASYAVIENSAIKSQDVYRVGDTIGDVRVNNIEQNRVVVLNAGVLLTLDLALTGQNSAAAKVVAQAPSPVQANVNGGDVVRVASTAERQINARASAENLSKATEFLRKMKLSPHETNGKADGLAISGLGDSALSQLSGLKDGDVVQTVNGHPVPNQTKAAQVLKKARNLGSARLELQSGPEGKSLTFRTGSW